MQRMVGTGAAAHFVPRQPFGQYLKSGHAEISYAPLGPMLIWENSNPNAARALQGISHPSQFFDNFRVAFVYNGYFDDTSRLSELGPAPATLLSRGRSVC